MQKNKIKNYYTPIGIFRIEFEDDCIRSSDFTNASEDAEITYEDIYQPVADYFTDKKEIICKPDETLIKTDFQRKVIDAIIQIPIGNTMTYKDIAVKINKPKASRAVGTALAKNPLLLFYPCHRVVGINNQNSYKAGKWRKKWLLLHEKGLFDCVGIETGKVNLDNYNPVWESICTLEKDILTQECKYFTSDIHHIGSTAIKDIKSKPIIDIMLETENFKEKTLYLNHLLNVGYRFRKQFRPDWIFLTKGYDKKKMVHLHLVIKNSDFSNEHLIFRDNLIKHRSLALEYENLKVSLFSDLKNHPEKYTEQKSSFILKHSQKRY